MNHDSAPVAAPHKPPAPMPTLLVWLTAHTVLVGIVALLLLLLGPKDGPGWVVAVSPCLLGLAQATVLHRRLPLWATLLWPLATILGFGLSMGLVWFLYVGLGGCIGLCQACLLAAGRARGWFLWPLISGVGWLSGLGAWLLFDWAFSMLSESGSGNLALSLTVVLLPYALGTGLALRWMGRRGVGPRPSA